MLIRLLLAVDDPVLRRRAAKVVAQPNVLIYAVHGLDGMWEALAQDSADLVVVARQSLPANPGDLIRELQKLPDAPELIVLQERENSPDRMLLLAVGCFAVLAGDQPDATLAAALATLVRRRRDDCIRHLRGGQPGEQFQLEDFATTSPAMEAVIRLARRVAAADSSLLILGETGVGKEWLARAIHAEGARKQAPFIAVNTAALPETLLESELFGHERGAFTGAVSARRGCFELAHRGTLFLDEIGDMPPHLQSRLLRVLQDRKIQRLGSEQLFEVDVRVMAATHRNLEQAISEREFRSDLFYRLGVVSLTLPPLRERREDIPLLADAYRERFCLQLGRSVEAIEPAALEALVAYAWPGNVRELINVMERAVLLAEGTSLSLADLPENIARRVPDRSPAADPSALGLPAGWREMPLKEVRRELLRAFERTYLTAQLQATRGRVGEAARRAGMAARSFYQKMQDHGLQKEDFKAGRRQTAAGNDPNKPPQP
jgi:DNA-binding NtrC family response regulator